MFLFANETRSSAHEAIQKRLFFNRLAVLAKRARDMLPKSPPRRKPYLVDSALRDWQMGQGTFFWEAMFIVLIIAAIVLWSLFKWWRP